MKTSVELLVKASPGCAEKWLALVEDNARRSVLQKVFASEADARAAVAAYLSK